MVNEPYIFISYRSLEKKFALQLANDLRRSGVQVWMDILDVGLKVGDDWTQSLQDALDSCVGLIAILSPGYVSSGYCRKELKRGVSRKIPIFPVLLKNLEKQDDWPLEIQELHYISFIEADDTKYYNEQIQELISVVKEKLPKQIGDLPDQERQYLYDLIEQLENMTGVLEYVDLELESQKTLEFRPQPVSSKLWDPTYKLLLSKDSIFNEKVNDDLIEDMPVSTTAKDIFREHSRFVLLGDPGAGKSTTLRRMVLDLIQEKLAYPDTTPTPFFIALPEWQNEQSLLQFLNTHWILNEPLELLLETGDVVLFLDGLNEMGVNGKVKVEALRKLLHPEEWNNINNSTPNFQTEENKKKLEELEKEKQVPMCNPKNLVITCRQAEYESEFNLNLPKVYIKPLDANRIEQFLENYLGDDSNDFKTKFQIIENEMQESSFSMFLSNPYLLTAFIFTYLYSDRSLVPSTLYELLDKLVATLWERERVRNTTGWMEREDMESILSDLAFRMIDLDMPFNLEYKWISLHQIVKSTRYRPAYDSHKFMTIIDLCEKISILEKRGEFIRFQHQFMQEYFASIRLEYGGWGFRLKPSNYSSRWDNVFILLCGRSTKPDAIIKAISSVNLILAIRCLANGASFNSDTTDYIKSQVKKAIESDKNVKKLSEVIKYFDWNDIELLLEQKKLNSANEEKSTSLKNISDNPTLSVEDNESNNLLGCITRIRSILSVVVRW